MPFFFRQSSHHSPSSRSVVSSSTGSFHRPRGDWFRGFALFVAMFAPSITEVACGDERIAVRVFPESIILTSPEASEQIVIIRVSDTGNAHDMSRSVQYQPVDPTIVSVSTDGRVTALRDGVTEIRIECDGVTRTLPVRVSGLATPTPVSFRNEVIPVLSKAGCNSGGCHGKAEGQNGFKLSVFGYDALADYNAMVRDGRGRRIFPAVPENSLLLTKATGIIPHGGGIRIERDSRWHRLLLRWIREGLPLDEQKSSVVSIRVDPAEVSLDALSRLQLRVDAIDSSGGRLGVTAEADFQSNNDAIASVTRTGLIEATDVPGEAAILVRYMGHVAVCRVTRPRPASSFSRPPEANFVDKHLWDKLQKLNIQPSDIADDATFLRRVFLDIIGTLPTVAETKAFLDDSRADKRERLIEHLLNRPEYADFWAQKWTDLLQVDKDILGPQSAMAMSRWVRSQFRQNVPFDVFAQRVVTAEGSTLNESPAGFFQVQADAEKSARAISQLFLGVRIECAQCHHHPFERWDRSDYFAWAGLFSGLDRKPGLNGSVKIVSKPATPLNHPGTGEPVALSVLGGKPDDSQTQEDARQTVARWMTSRENPWFAKTIVNRMFAHFFGRGLVEPLDDLRATNPASNEELLLALEHHFIDVNYDLKALIRTLAMSQAYQRTSQPNDANRLDDQNYSHALWKPIPAEVLLDALSQATGVPEQFDGWPTGYRAVELWDNKLPSQFLQVFGRPTRQTVCACERGTEPSIAQALHLMNSETTSARVGESTRAGRATCRARSL